MLVNNLFVIDESLERSIGEQINMMHQPVRDAFFKRKNKE
jgi:hypothetical protein